MPSTSSDRQLSENWLTGYDILDPRGKGVIDEDWLKKRPWLAESNSSIPMLTSEPKRVTWNELFWDLVFVASLGELARQFSKDDSTNMDLHPYTDPSQGSTSSKPNLPQFLTLCCLYLPLFRFWLHSVGIMHKFNGSDGYFSSTYFFGLTMAGVACLSVNIGSCVDVCVDTGGGKNCTAIDISNDVALNDPGCRDFDVIYMALRVVLASCYFAMIFQTDIHTDKMYYLFCFLVNLIFSGVSLFLILYFGGTVTTASTIVWVILITLDCLDHFIPTIFGVKKWFQTITIPMNAGILVERVGLFVIMSFGTIVVSASQPQTDLDSNPGTSWWDNRYVIRYTVIFTCFLLKMIYFDAGVAEEECGGLHPLKRQTIYAETWKLLHAPYCLCLIILGAEASKGIDDKNLHGIDPWVYNFCIAGSLIFCALFLLLYKANPTDPDFKKFRNVKIAARLIAAGLTVSMKFLPGNQDGNKFVTAWYIIVSLPSLVVVLVDEQCRNKVRKRREEIEKVAEKNSEGGQEDYTPPTIRRGMSEHS